ncbi:MAG: ThuA domain-containing protein [Patescibacteria group bacterium]
MRSKRALILLGGGWHDFDGFARFAADFLAGEGYTAEAEFDLDSLLRLKERSYDLVVSYTCFTADGGPAGAPVGLSPGQVEALAGWVNAGGAFLPLHAATVIGESGQVYEELAGGAFIKHPEQFAYTVLPMYGEHPVTAGVEAFTVHDELYIQRYDTAAVQVHMVAADRGAAYPMVWTKTHGRGRVVHIAPGHDGRTWGHEAYQRLLRQAVRWAAGDS